MSEPDNHIQHVAYYANRHCSRQWSLFLELVFDELLSSAGQEGASGFLRHIGGRIAAELPIGECDTLEHLEKVINDILSQLDWGYVTIAADNQKMRICHIACPVPGSSPERIEASLLAMSMVLEELYKTWLQQQGGEVDVPIACISRRVEQRECTFLYGR
ncbi:cellulose biosynthesis protein BcsD [Vreelandella populi]|uniref:cellulose biosynthesis protein BcsD n=1 Tax=Vreelandella populi TaxID=2498858 RepID=UPI00163BD887|nr:cellulose biosynthesis protein BcsD [Halomonas populi]